MADNQDKIRILVLSGGGGRGAFHVGVYKYLAEHGWDPQVVIGTSIGAVNGAAIVQGLSPQELEEIWIPLQEQHIEALPPGMRWLARKVVGVIFKDVVGSRLPQVRPEESDIPKNYWPPLSLVPKWLAERLIGRWTNLLDTAPLRDTLLHRMKFDAQKIADSQKALLIAATNVRTGERMIFSNRHVTRRSTGEERDDVKYGIDINRIVASCSIPLIYPWTYDPETDAHYWDGAVVSNTPLGAALDVIQNQPAEIPAEVVVVLMTPWRDGKDRSPAGREELPSSFGEAITWTLDWALLASFRESLNTIQSGNRLAEQERTLDKSSYQYRHVGVKIIAPENFMSANRIIDYETQATLELIKNGYDAARKVFES